MANIVRFYHMETDEGKIRKFPEFLDSIENALLSMSSEKLRRVYSSLSGSSSLLRGTSGEQRVYRRYVGFDTQAAIHDVVAWNRHSAWEFTSVIFDGRGGQAALTEYLTGLEFITGDPNSLYRERLPGNRRLWLTEIVDPTEIFKTQ